MEEEYTSSEEKLVSEFNEAKYQILRLHNIWNECKSARENGNLARWKWKLDTAMIELWQDAKRIDGDEEQGLAYQLNIIDGEIENAIDKKKLKDLYNLLKKKEMLLREIQQKAGKGGKLRNVDDDGL